MSLAVVVDGVAMADEEGRAIWERFSAYMEEHRGDLGGFAKQEGFKSAHPRSEGGKAVLVLSRTEPQEAYGRPEPSSRGKQRSRR
jgi:hypothetical protein